MSSRNAPQWPPVVDRATWDDARSVLLQQEKALTRMKDAISAARRRMPMVGVPADYAFRARMGWQLPWYSTVGSEFNEDFGATVDGEERQAISVFVRRGDQVLHACSRVMRCAA